MKLSVIIFTLLNLFFVPAFASTQTTSAKNFSTEQTKQIEAIIHNYLLQNPQIMMEVFKKLEAQQNLALQQQAQKAIVVNAKSLFNSPATPMTGNPQGKIALVEFFDYQCPHCKDVTAEINALVQANPQLRVIHKEYPIFPGSQYAAKAALASNSQKKYAEFHAALMSAQNPLTQKDVLKIAKSVGLDTEQLEKDMQANWTQQEIDANYRLAQLIGINGTPAFIISSSVNPDSKAKVFFIPGAVNRNTLQGYIDKAKQP